MRYTFLAGVMAVGLGLALGGCGSSSKGKGDMGGKDLSGPKLNCLAFSSCVYDCLAQNKGDINTCAQNICIQEAKPNTYKKWVAAVTCGEDYCKGVGDGGVAKCTQPDQSPGMMGDLLCDPGVTYAECNSSTYKSTVCSPCLDEARNFWFYDISVNPINPGPPTGMCPDPSTADCMGAKAACATEFDNCLNDP